MGLPEILIEFKTKAQTAVTRSQNGIVAAINQYFDGLVREGVLYGDAENTADIDVNAQRDWLAQKYDISEYSDEQIRKAKTGSYVFVTADVTFCDAIEDLKFSINME